jgi:hypothetical protein
MEMIVSPVQIFMLIILALSAYGIPGSAEAENSAETEGRVTGAPGGAANPQDTQPGPFPSWFPKLLGLQFDGIYQVMPSFHSPYEGERSLSFHHHAKDLTTTYGIYLGSQLSPRLQAYVDTEMFQGHGISEGQGLGGYLNGDVIRAGSSKLPKVPYVARAYLRYYCPLSFETEKVERGVSEPKTEKVDRSMDQIPGEQPVSRWEVKIGKLAPTDDFDLNRYADNNRTQFMNYDFLFNTAWDYASDTRGYSFGVVAALYQPRWRVALGIFMEPNTANGANYDWFDKGSAMLRELGYNLELTLEPNDMGTVVRLLTYFNEGRMGNYEAALESGRATSSVPDLLLVEKLGGTKYGLGLNFEQPVADEGETGLFGRIGWNDGHHETWSYTESDRHASLGAQVSGVHWKRPDDRVGIAWGINGLSAPHKDYLAAGGVGILLGDGKLNYGYEQVLEVYYRVQLTKWLAISPDFQFIQDPGYNRDRGPVEIYGLRVRVSW